MTAPEQPLEYDPNVPEKPSDSLSISQPDINDNFRVLFDRFKVDHVSLDDALVAGNHTVVHLIEQKKAIQTDVSEISMYSKDVEDQTDQIFLKYQGNGQEFQYTNYQIYSVKETNTQTSYFTFLPGKMIVYFGLFKVTGVRPSTKRLSLTPRVARKIISVNFTNSESGIMNNGIKQIESDGIITQLEFFIPFNLLSSQYYLVVANI